jgi:hypothetical protein
MMANQVEAHNAAIYRMRMAAFRRMKMSGAAYNDRAAPQLIDAKWDASAERATRGTFVIDRLAMALWANARLPASQRLPREVVLAGFLAMPALDGMSL